MPKNARWNDVKVNARSANIGKIVNEAMASIEKENISLKGVLPEDYSRPALDKQRLGDLVDLISTISMKTQGQKDVFGRVFYHALRVRKAKAAVSFIRRSRLCSCLLMLVEMLEPYKGRIYDPYKVQAVCLFSRKNLLNSMVAASAMYPCMGKSPISRLGAWQDEFGHSRH